MATQTLARPSAVPVRFKAHPVRVVRVSSFFSFEVNWSRVIWFGFGASGAVVFFAVLFLGGAL